MLSHRIVAVLAIFSALSGCSVPDPEKLLAEEPRLEEFTTVSNILKRLPPPEEPITVAVYRFDDKTGQNKPSDDFPEYSRAVTQGGAAILAKALYDAGDGRWFNVLEREGLADLAQERKIIRATREEYAAPDGSRLNNLGPLLYAGVLLQGGIVAYESDTITGGFGARYLGIGGDVQYRRDVVTVALRAVSVKTGQVVLAVNTSKTIFLSAMDGNLFRFTSLDELLQIESGITMSEPPQFAARQAIELAVYSMIMEGAEKGLWGFANSSTGNRLVANYVGKRDNEESVLEDADNAFGAQQIPSHRSLPSESYVPPPPPPSRPIPPAPTALPRPVPPAINQAPPPPPAAQIPIRQLPESAKRVKPAEEKGPIRVTPEELKRKLKEIAENRGKANEDNVDTSSTESKDGLSGNPATGGQVIYCGPSGCVPAYEAR